MTNDVAKTPTWQVPREARAHARSLRRDMTNAERIIWYGVRAHRLNGAAFRRQTPIGPFIVDFVSHAAKLVIEIDGGQHFEPAYEARDARRDAFLRSKGYRVLRFNNHDVMRNRDGVLETIAAAIGEAVAPSLTLPRKRGRGHAELLGEAVAPSPPSPASGGGGRSAEARRESARGESPS